MVIPFGVGPYAQIGHMPLPLRHVVIMRQLCAYAPLDSCDCCFLTERDVFSYATAHCDDELLHVYAAASLVFTCPSSTRFLVLFCYPCPSRAQVALQTP